MRKFFPEGMNNRLTKTVYHLREADGQMTDDESDNGQFAFSEELLNRDYRSNFGFHIVWEE